VFYERNENAGNLMAEFSFSNDDWKVDLHDTCLKRCIEWSVQASAELEAHRATRPSDDKDNRWAKRFDDLLAEQYDAAQLANLLERDRQRAHAINPTQISPYSLYKLERREGSKVRHTLHYMLAVPRLRCALSLQFHGQTISLRSKSDWEFGKSRDDKDVRPKMLDGYEDATRQLVPNGRLIPALSIRVEKIWG
jgi:hypothetical protein